LPNTQLVAHASARRDTVSVINPKTNVVLVDQSSSVGRASERSDVAYSLGAMVV
jgi:DNA-binding beta-propeller fold protein YncE